MSLTQKLPYDELVELILLSIDGRISESQFKLLESQIIHHQQARDCYYKFMTVYTGLSEYNNLGLYFKSSRETTKNSPLDPEDMGIKEVNDVEESWLGQEMWEELLEYEKTSPAVEIPKEEPKRELIQKVVYPPSSTRKVSKFEIFTLITSAAAVILFVLFIKFAPADSPAVDVAELVDQMNVKWSPSTGNLKNGRRMWTDEGPFELKKGIAKIKYDEGVDVMIEGPAVFQIQRTGIYLEYGCLYSYVSAAGLGFKVETPTSQFIDMGTEFGVQADVNGSSELHVTKGKVQLFAGTGKRSKTGQMVTGKKAVRFNANNGEIKSIPLEKKAFVRQFDSNTGFVLRGQKPINPDIRLTLVDDMQAYPDGSTDFHGSETLGGSGKWDTNATIGNPTANIRTDKKDGSMTLCIQSYSRGTRRGAGAHDLKNTISQGESGIVFFRFFSEKSTRENLQFMGLHYHSGIDPIKGSNTRRDGLAAGFGLVDSNKNSSGTSLDIITTGQTPVVLGRLQQGCWYDVWIAADYADNTFDLYIRRSAGPGSGYPGLPHSKYLIDSGIAFGIPTTKPLGGIMFLCDDASNRTASLWVDDIYWSGGRGM